jgi:hypothetical protein
LAGTGGNVTDRSAGEQAADRDCSANRQTEFDHRLSTMVDGDAISAAIEDRAAVEAALNGV